MQLDMVIAGLPKSGTSSLFRWLDCHPQLKGSTPKETFFFMDSSHPLSGRNGHSVGQDGLTAIERYFGGNSEGKVRFEGTTHTFYQATARQHLAALEPQPLVVMVLREPGRRLLSSFRFTRDNLSKCDKSLTFNQYVDWLLTGKVEELDRYFWGDASLWVAKRELELGKYAAWLDWWLEKLARNRLHLMLFEQLRQEPEAVIKEVCAPLGVDPGFYEGFSFEGQNVTYAVGKQRVHRLARRVASVIPRNLFRERVKRYYLRWQNQAASPEFDYDEGLRRVRAYFAPWNRDLANRYELDLERWWGTSILAADGLQHER